MKEVERTTKQNLEVTPKIYLHFTGTSSQYYTPRTFLREAKEQGFGRIVPFPVPFGTKILFSTYKPNPKVQGQPHDGRALVFAVGVVTGWHVKPKNENAIAFWSYYLRRLYEEELVVSYDSTPRTIKRACGSYTCDGGVGLSPSVDHYEFLKETMRRWNEENPDRKVHFHDFQWIITGPIVHENGGVTIGVVNNVKFARGLIPVTLTDQLVPSPDNEQIFVPLYQILTVRSYEKGEPIPAKELWRRDLQVSSLF